MKKFLFGILSFVVLASVVLLTSCNKDSNENNELSSTVDPNHEHIEVVDPMVWPTCQNVGWTEGRHCIECGEITVAQEEIEKYECAYTWYTTKYPTTTEDGEEVYKCYRGCETVIDTRIIYAGTQGMEYEENDDGTYYLKSKGYCSDNDVVIPKFYKGKPVTGIASGAFGASTINLTISENISYIAPDAFVNSSNLQNIYVVSENMYFSSIDGNLYSKDGKVLIKYANAKDEQSFEVPSGVVSISESAFKGAYKLTYINVTNGVETIGAAAFSGCRNLLKIDFPSSLISVGGGAFYNCTNLEEVCFLSSKTELGNYMFQYCSSLKTVVLPDELTEIPEGLFWECGSLESIIIPETVTKIGHQSFLCCYSLIDIVIPEGVTYIGASAFYSCGRLESITIPKSVTAIGTRAFYDCRAMKSINVDPESEYFESVDGILYSKGMETLMCYAIGKEESTFVIPDGVMYIMWDAFYQCETLKHVVIPDSIIYIGDRAFERCFNLETVVIGNGVVDIPEYAFHYTALKEVSFSNSVKSICSNAFSWCYDLETINFAGTVDEWLAIEKASSYVSSNGSKYIAYCTDGTVDKEGNVTRN